jgi:hypothetical protein
MKRITHIIISLASTTFISLAVIITTSLNVYAKETYSPYVDAKGNITLPSDFDSKWVFVGTWSIAAEDVKQSADASGHGAASLHNVYTQPGTVEAFRNTGKFPDGAVLIKELLNTETTKMTTGKVSRANKNEGWFIMVKDTKNRFPENRLWGDGWGWSLFDVNKKVTSKDYKTECLGCHIPAKQNDWVYLEGYPMLRKR